MLDHVLYISGTAEGSSNISVTWSETRTSTVSRL